jgi:arylformamidase
MMEVAPWAGLDDNARGVAFSPSTFVDGDFGPFIQAYKDQSAKAYALHPRVETLSYGAGAMQTVDLFLPESDAPAPLHLFIHGGYWQELSKRESCFAALDSLALGMAFGAIDYPLAPDAQLEEIVDCCDAALGAVLDASPRLGLDPGRIVVSGSSAGAHLAAILAGCGAAGEKINGLVLLSGIYDLRPLVGTYINDALGLAEDRAALLSPQLQPLRAMPATLIAWAEHEPEAFKHQSRAFAEKLVQEGADVESLEVTGHNHFDIVHRLADPTALGPKLRSLAG